MCQLAFASVIFTKSCSVTACSDADVAVARMAIESGSGCVRPVSQSHHDDSDTPTRKAAFRCDNPTLKRHALSFPPPFIMPNV